MANDEVLKHLNEDFAEKVVTLLDICRSKGAEMCPYCTKRDPWEQARLWRQSRTSHEIRCMIGKLSQEGAMFLAEVLDSVGPQYGRWATNALPGSSWHQWGLAVDCFAVGPNGRAIWTPKFESYEVYANEAKNLGLMAGYFWKRMDAVHIQDSGHSVRGTYTWKDIDMEMRKRHES